MRAGDNGAGPRRLHAFSRDLRSARRTPRRGAPGPVYVRLAEARGPFAAPLPSSRIDASALRGGLATRPCRDDPDHDLGPHPRRAAAARSRLQRAHIWLEPLELAAVARHDRSSSRRPTQSAPGSRALRCAAEARRRAPCSARRARRDRRRRRPSAATEARAADAGAGRGAGRDRARELNPRYTFDQFVIGDGNRLAHAAALAVAEMPGQAYNPLFICGPPGLGKTHLLHSIAQLRARARRRADRPLHDRRGVHRPSSSARCSGGGIEAFKAALPRRRRPARRRRPVPRRARRKTEEEFFHTFNALHEAGAQLVLTSDRLPRDIGALEDRLRERFESGLVTDVEPARPRAPA